MIRKFTNVIEWELLKKDFYKELEKEINKISPNTENKKCPECGGNLIVRKGRYGLFLRCSNYPKCTHIEKLNKK